MEEENQQLEGGAYEVIRARLDTQAIELRQKLEQLNVERKEIFGAVEKTLLIFISIIKNLSLLK